VYAECRKLLVCLLVVSASGCAHGGKAAAKDVVVDGVVAAEASSCGRLPPKSDGWKAWMKSAHARCENGARSACTDLGWTLKTGEDGSTDHSAALQFLECACSSGSDAGCNGLGTMFDHGHGTPVDEPRAAALYQTACGHGYATACTNLGVLYELGSVTGTPDYAKAASLFDKACNAGDESGCSGLAYLYEMGRGVQKDRARALELYEAACKKDEETACSNLGVAYEKGDGRPQDYARALELYEKACSRSHAGACANYALMYLYGRGVQKSPERAAEILQVGCSAWVTRDRAQTCGLLAEVVLEHKLPHLSDEQVESYLLDSCRAGRASSCNTLAQKCLTSAPPRVDDAKALLSASCEMGSAQACEVRKKLDDLD